MIDLAEEEKRRRALLIHEDMLRGVTRQEHAALYRVTSAPETLPTAAKGVRAVAEAPPDGQKIASSSAAARAPEAAARWPTGPQSNRGATGSSAPEAAARATDPEIPERLKTKPNKWENEFMLNLMILRNTLRTNAPSCRDRARRAGKYVWRDIRLMLTLVNRIQDALIKTMPESRDQYYTAYARHGHYKMEIDGPIDTAQHVLITARHLGAITDAAMSSECILCMREGNEINKCPLRDALLEVAPPTNLEPEGMIRKCEYRDAAGKILHGEEVKEI